jgi:hypothetical protein
VSSRLRPTIQQQQQQQQQQQNGQNLLVVSQDTQGKELIAVADEQTVNGVNVVLDSYCSCTYSFLFIPFLCLSLFRQLSG